MNKRESFLLSLIILIGLFLRFYHLDSLPMEMYGDIVEGYKFTQEILAGKWPFYFVLGNGPLFFYFVAIVAKMFGLFFLTMKVASAIVGIAIILVSYYLGKELFNKETGLITAFLVAISKWPLIFSRLGNMPILVPFFTALIALLYIKLIKQPNNWLFWIIIGVLLALGLYIYPGYFITPFAVLVAFIFQGYKFWKKNILKMLVALGCFLIIGIPFFKLFFGNFQQWTGSSTYMGSKIFVAEGKLANDWPYKFINNIKKTFWMFYGTGDVSFRNNPTGQRAIDPISGFFLIYAILVGTYKKKERKKFLLLLITIFILASPSMLVLNVETDVPNINRTIGIFPFVFVIIASGFKTLKDILEKFLPKTVVLILSITVFIFVSKINLSWYFKDYSYSLPNHNEGFPRLITDLVDKLPDNVHVFMYGPGWGDWGQPDWRAISFEFRTPKKYAFIDKENFSCDSFTSINSSRYFILNPNSPSDLEEIKRCFPGGKIEKYYTPKYKFPLFTSYYLK